MGTREEFEKLNEIAEIFKGLHPTIIWFCDKSNKYATSFSGFNDRVIWLNGAWYVFQEQQKKIDALKNKMQTALNKACMLQNSSGERIYTELKELLK